MLRSTAAILALSMAVLATAPAGAQTAEAKAAAAKAAVDILAYYPAAAKAAGVEGMVTLHCDVTAHGAYTQCQVISELPQNAGFGDAALSIAKASVENPALTLSEDEITAGRDLIFRFALSPPSITPNLLTPPHPQPKWVLLPTGDDFAEEYPRAAETKNEGGRAVLRCVASASGAMAHCDIIEEAPLGEGFGKAAVALIRHFRFAPTTPDGWPVEGYVVMLPIRFVPPITSY